MAATDIFIIVYPTARAQVPCKLYEMMMFRKPIVALMGEGDAADILQRYGLGLRVNPDDSQSLASAIVRSAQQSASNHFGRGQSDALSAFDGRKLTGNLATLFTTFSNRSREGRHV